MPDGSDGNEEHFPCFRAAQGIHRKKKLLNIVDHGESTRWATRLRAVSAGRRDGVDHFQHAVNKRVFWVFDEF
jgi:hypothetical protein